MRASIVVIFNLFALKYASTDCVSEGYDRQHEVVKCTSVSDYDLSELVKKTVGTDHHINLTLVNTNYHHLNSLEDFMNKRVENLTVINNNEYKIYKYAFSKFESLQSLTVHDSFLEYYGFKIENRHSFLLDLANNTIDTKNSICSGIPSLHTLILKQNLSNLVEDDIFGQCSQLYTLDISYNNLTNITENPFRTLPNLYNLNLSNNPIRYISRNTFVDLSTLHNLDISYCSIKYLEAGSFNGLHKLSNLNLENNKIAILVPHTFKALNQLATLKLQGNAIKDIQPQALTGLHSLEHLNLKYNQLTVFPALRNLSCKMSNVPLRNLQKLDLGHNNISAITLCAFESFPNLTILLLNNNILSELLLEVFSPLSKLTVLKLTNNWLTQIDSAVLHPLSSLTQLDISYNQLVSFDPKKIMSHLKQLKYMGISGNHWECYHLQELFLYLNKTGVDTKPHHSASFYSDNVNGIRCVINIHILEERIAKMPSNLSMEINNNATAKFKEVNFLLEEMNRTYSGKLNKLSNFNMEINRNLTVKLEEISYNNSDVIKLLYIIIILFIIVVCAYVIVKVCGKIRDINKHRWCDQAGFELINLRSS